MVYVNIKKCRLYQHDYQEWYQKTRLEKTWSNFKDHFTQAFKEPQKSARTSKTEGYAANVQATQANAAIFTKMQQDHTLALANLTTATQANRTLVALLMKKILEISSQVATLTVKLATAQSENACMEKLGHRSAPAEHRYRASNNQTLSNKTLHQYHNVYSRSGHKF